MPFRIAPSGHNAKKCLRGEDWEWLGSYAAHRQYAPWFGALDSSLSSLSEIPDRIDNLALPWPWKQLRWDNLSAMYEFNDAIWPYWFTYFRLDSMEVQSAADYDDPIDLAPDITPAQLTPVIRSGIVIPGGNIVSRRPDPNDRVLHLQDMQNFFADCRDAIGFRTISEGIQEGYASSPLYEQHNHLGGTSDKTWSRWYNVSGGSGFVVPPETQVRWTWELYCLVKCQLVDLETNWQTRWCIVNVNKSGTSMNTQFRRNRFTAVQVDDTTMRQIVSTCTGLLGWNLTDTWPRPTSAGDGVVIMNVRQWFMVVTPWYLQPTWQ